MGLVLRILDGPRAGQTVEVQPGAPFVIGRGQDTGLPLVWDPMVSKNHTAIEAQSEAWLMKDMGSRNGTYLNNGCIPIAVLKDGDEIRAGSTRLRIESGAPPQQRELTPHEKLILALRSFQEPLYAIIDTAHSPDAFSLLANSREPLISLFDGPGASSLRTVAPYLAAFMGGDTTLPSLLFAGWGKAWVTFLTSPAPMPAIRAHLRSLLTVQRENGKPLYFRFYDPRVLRQYLDTCNQTELTEFYGPVKRFLVEDEDPETLVDCSVEQGKLRKNAMRYLEPSPTSGTQSAAANPQSK